MKKWVKYSLYIILVLLLAAVLGFYIWSQQTYKPTSELKSLVTTKDYKKSDDLYVFQPKQKTEVGIILYPGAKVEPLAYGYIAKELQQQGYFVVIPQMRFNMAIFEEKKANYIIEEYGDIDRWVIGGHSLGGVVAASYTEKNPDHIAGLFLYASYPSKSVDFSTTNLPTLSIFAEHDQVSPPEDIFKHQSNLSNVAVLHEIIGGNHAGFGMYGKQSDDGEATISNLQQQKKVIKQTLKWLEKTKTTSDK
ncbi:MAG: alpha/beta hydrolase [Kurthia sp.]|nr:alpha/beta hydrolase [Candidatus Kurthia equi]